MIWSTSCSYVSADDLRPDLTGTSGCISKYMLQSSSRYARRSARGKPDKWLVSPGLATTLDRYGRDVCGACPGSAELKFAGASFGFQLSDHLGARGDCLQGRAPWASLWEFE